MLVNKVPTKSLLRFGRNFLNTHRLPAINHAHIVIDVHYVEAAP